MTIQTCPAHETRFNDEEGACPICEIISARAKGKDVLVTGYPRFKAVVLILEGLDPDRN